MKQTAIIGFLLLALSAWGANGEGRQRINTIRTTTYQAVLKDTAWVSGAVVARIHFVKFDRLGRKRVENSLNPDGSANRKIVYFYDSQDRVAEEVVASVKQGIIGTFRYEYNERGEVIKLMKLDENKKVIFMRRASDMEAAIDSTYLFRQSEQLGFLQSPAKDKKVAYTYDTWGNWVKRVEYNGVNPEFIVKRTIEYMSEENDWEKIPLRGRVKWVNQSSYVALAKDEKAETIDRGSKKGLFFRYQFNEKGKKSYEESYSDTGILLRKTHYEYDEEGNLQKESWISATGIDEGCMKWTYNAEGGVARKTLLNAKGEVIRKGVFRYDIEGNCIHEIWFEMGGTKFSEFRYQYDSYGQQVKKEVLLRVGEGPSYYPIERSWSFQGRIVEEVVKLFPGIGYHHYTYAYNSKGEVISGSETLDGEPEVKFIYKFYNDHQGNWTKRIKFVEDVPVVYEEREYSYFP